MLSEKTETIIASHVNALNLARSLNNKTVTGLFSPPLAMIPTTHVVLTKQYWPIDLKTKQFKFEFELNEFEFLFICF